MTFIRNENLKTEKRRISDARKIIIILCSFASILFLLFVLICWRDHQGIKAEEAKAKIQAATTNKVCRDCHLEIPTNSREVRRLTFDYHREARMKAALDNK